MKNKKKTLLVIVAALLVFLTVGGTVAWLTRTSSVTNSFTVGEFSEPTTSPLDATQSINIDGNLYEPSWTPDTKIYPGATIAKDPYVGIGPGSESGIVYVYVQNNFSNKVYFTINTGWEAVANETVAGTGANSYTSGIFKYTAGLTGSATDDVWTTTPLFSNILVDDAANTTDLDVNSKTIVVKSFIHQTSTGESDANILAAAKAAFNS